jgi:hypothetical protein
MLPNKKEAKPISKKPRRPSQENAKTQEQTGTEEQKYAVNQFTA